MFHSKEYNFDINEMINSFNFFDFSKSEKGNYRSGVLVITNKQYVLSYTNNYGKGNHFITVARILNDLNGGGKISSDDEYEKVKDKLKDYMLAKITFFYK